MRNAHCALTMTCALATAGVGMSAATAVAQDSEILPAIVVEGATLDAATSPKNPKHKRSRHQKRCLLAKKAGYGTSTGTPSQPQNEGQVEAEALTGPSPGTDDSVQGVPIRKLGTPVSVVTGADLQGAANSQCSDATSQSAGRRGQQ